jgi:hypothetical protein
LPLKFCLYRKIEQSWRKELKKAKEKGNSKIKIAGSGDQDELEASVPLCE